MKTYYHGTTEAAAQSILSEGLVPRDADKWKAILLRSSRNLYGSEQGETWVYVSPDRSTAKSYALTRTKYLKAKPGARIKGYRLADLRKLPDAPVDPDARPALLRITVPDELLPIGHATHETAFLYIPAEYIAREPP